MTPPPIDLESDGTSLRPATEDDLIRIAGIEARCHTSEPWGIESFRAEMTKPYSRFLVLTDDETDSKIFGYVVYWVMAGECQILNVVVEVEFRGLGFGKKMLRHAIKDAIRSDCGKIFLNVRKSNLPALHLYQSLGLTVSHIRKNFYSNQEDAYEMILNLDDKTNQNF